MPRERGQLSLEFRRLKLSDFIPLITLYRKVAPATLYYWPGLLQPPNLRNFTRWLLRVIAIICALNNFSKFLMYLKPDKSIPFLFIGAFSSRNLIGVAFLMKKKREPLIAEVGIGVIDEYQGKGVGSRLMEGIIAEGKNLGLSRLYLTVLSSNYKAINLYRKYGFLETKKYKDCCGNLVILMERQI